MSEWKEAFWLTKYELKRSTISFLIFLLFLFGAIFLLSEMSVNYFTQRLIAMDLFFIVALGLLTHRPKEIFSWENMIKGDKGANDIIILNHLPIKMGIIVKHRFLSHILFAIPFQVLLLIGFYMNSPELQNQIPIDAYVRFSIIWICIGLFISFMMVAFEAGYKSSNMITSTSIGLLIVLILLIIASYNFIPGGFIQWTIQIANYQPVLSVIIPVVIIIISWNYWMRKMLKQMKQVDYL